MRQGNSPHGPAEDGVADAMHGGDFQGAGGRQAALRRSGEVQAGGGERVRAISRNPGFAGFSQATNFGKQTSILARGGRPSMSEQSSLSSSLHGHSKNYYVLFVDAPPRERGPWIAFRCFPCPIRAELNLRSPSRTPVCTLARRFELSCDLRPAGLCSLPPHAHF